MRKRQGHLHFLHEEELVSKFQDLEREDEVDDTDRGSKDFLYQIVTNFVNRMVVALRSIDRDPFRIKVCRYCCKIKCSEIVKVLCRNWKNKR